MKTYDQAPDEVRERVIALIKKYHPDLELVQLRVDLLMASTDTEDAHAVTLGGYPCLAVVKIVGPKERAKGCGDAEIVIDRDAYEAMSGAKRDALLDHELYHLEITRDKMGRPKKDDHQRPKLKMRKHDFQFGWFAEIARRHQENAIEVQQAQAFIAEQGELFFGLDSDVTSRFLPTEDSAARESAPGTFMQRVVDKVSDGSGAEGFVELAKRHGTTVEIRAGNSSVKIDADGVHTTPTDEQLDEATKLAFRDGHLTRSALQRSLRVGYNHACAIVDRLVGAKILGSEGEGGRFGLLTPETVPAA
jgi:hypothetical protein